MTFEEFKKVDLRAGKVISAERVSGSDKLLRLEVDLGDPSAGSGLGKRQIVAGIGKKYEPEALVGKNIVIVANLEQREFVLRPIRQAQDKQAQDEPLRLKSNGMLLAAHDDDGGPVLLITDGEVPSGSSVG